MKLAKNIMNFRKQKNMTQDELGHLLGVSAAAISKWETENAIPDIYMLVELADCFQVTTDELLGRKIQKPRVAIADDVGFIRDNLKRILAENDYWIVAEASNGKELLSHKDLHKAELIILNLNMPVMNGFETLPILKESYPDAKVLICTGDTSSETHAKLLQLGVDGYLFKPFKEDDLINAVKQLI